VRIALLIARKEILDHLLSLKFHVSLAVMAVLLALSAYVMYSDYRLRQENYAVMRERAKPRAGELDLMAVVEPRPLSVFARGLDVAMTRGFDITFYSGIVPHSPQTPALSLLGLFTAPDLLYVVKALLSLITLLFAYDAFTGELENGTLKQVLSGAVSRTGFLGGKMLGGYAVIALPFLFTLGVVLAALLTRPGIILTGDDAVRLLIMAGAALVYIALFFSLGMLVSALARGSASRKNTSGTTRI
jgi:ABC-type transport system involved in multi-copper enzyme maturation permease subunit